MRSTGPGAGGGLDSGAGEEAGPPDGRRFRPVETTLSEHRA